MLMLSTYQVILEEGPAKIDTQMIWTIILIVIVVLFILFGRRILILINGKNYDDDGEPIEGGEGEDKKE